MSVFFNSVEYECTAKQHMLGFSFYYNKEVWELQETLTPIEKQETKEMLVSFNSVEDEYIAKQHTLGFNLHCYKDV